MRRIRGWVSSDTRVILKLHNILLARSLNSSHYTSIEISLCEFRGRVNFFARVNLKLHDPCEVLARIWKSQNSPRLLTWIYSILGPKYAEPCKPSVSKIEFKRSETLRHEKCILWRRTETPTQSLFAKEQRNSDTQKLDLTQMNTIKLNETILPARACANFYFFLQNELPKSR